jgi:hypothetical protein
MIVKVPKGTIIKFSSKPCSNWVKSKKMEIDANGMVTTPFLKHHKMMVDVAHEEDCGCGADHPFGAVIAYSADGKTRLVVSTAWGVEFHPNDKVPDEAMVIHPTNEDYGKEWFARFGYDLIYELHFKKKGFWGRLKLLTVFGAQLIWRYLFKNRG